MKPLPTFYAAYTGPSMNPTLWESDLIEVRPYGNHPIQVGDVIFFTPPTQSGRIVHRVIRVTPQGVFTRGDHNSRFDPWPLQPQDIHGQVIAAWHGRRRRIIAGGWGGRLCLVWLPGWRLLDRAVAYLGRRFKIRPGQLAWLIPVHLRPKTFFFQTGERPQGYLLWLGHRIGRFDPLHQGWVIPPPFSWFVAGQYLEMPSDRREGSSQ